MTGKRKCIRLKRRQEPKGYICGCKVTMKASSGGIVSAGSVLGDSEPAQTMLHSHHNYLRAKRLASIAICGVEIHTLEWAVCAYLFGLVPRVLHRGGRPQVPSDVIQPISVTMVDTLAGLAIHDFTVHQGSFAAPVSVGIKASSSLERPPSMRVYSIVVLIIDSSGEPVAQIYVFHSPFIRQPAKWEKPRHLGCRGL